ncbi:MAG TPA: rod shape-determining protein MreD [Pirellulales bacterium]|nr:rod shape-determining protein MreD [Pirellulales bacterium]
MQFVFLAAAVYAAAVVQTSLAPVLEVRHVMPDLFALVAVLWRLNTASSIGDRAAGNSHRSFFAAALIGLAFDLTSSGPLGVGLGLFAVVGFLIAWLASKLDLTHPFMQLVTVFLATSAIAAGEAALCRIRGEASLSWATLLVRAISVGVYTAGVAVPIVMVLGWFRNVGHAVRADG